MEQNNTPLYTAMKKYIEDKAMAFHTPDNFSSYNTMLHYE